MRFLLSNASTCTTTIVLVTALLFLGHYPTTTLAQSPEVDQQVVEEGDGFFSNENSTNVTEGLFDSDGNTTDIIMDGNATNVTNVDMDDDGDEFGIDNGTTNATDAEGDDNTTMTNPALPPSAAPDSDPLPTGPTLAPTAAARVPLVGFITLELVDTASVMDDSTMDLFVEISDAFLEFNLFIAEPTLTLPGSNDTYVLPLVNEDGLMVQMTRQSLSLLVDDNGSRRSLQQSTLRPLYVTLQVTGVAKKPSGGTAMESETNINSTNADMEGGSDDPMELTNLDDFDFDLILQQIFIEKQAEYIEALQIEGDTFFGSIDQVNVLLQSTIGDLQDANNDNEDPMDDSEDPDRESIGDNGGSSAWTDAPIVSSDGEDAFWTTPVIIGIAVGGGVLLLCCAIFLWYQCCFRKRNRGADDAAKATSITSSSGVKKSAPSTPKSKPWNRRRNKSDGIDGPVDSMADQHLMNTDNSSSNRLDDEVSDVASEVDLESQAMYSYNPRGDSGSVYTANHSIMKNQSYAGNDNMSYAYSLEPGIEASIVDGVLLNNTTMNQSALDSAHSRDMPIREIPQITQQSSSRGARNGSATNASNPGNDGFGDTQIETAASDLKLTESELAMLPSNLRSDDEGDDPSTAADSRGFPAISKKVIAKTIQAPSGKLGIVIDTTVEGPVVHNVNAESRLQGAIFPGDIIVAIDNVDTRAMSASAITALMVKTAGQERTLTVRREDTSN
ncbi:MAG: hypothetical protein SGILL_001810 [Bacillariaceae sp.]